MLKYFLLILTFAFVASCGGGGAGENKGGDKPTSSSATSSTYSCTAYVSEDEADIAQALGDRCGSEFDKISLGNSRSLSFSGDHTCEFLSISADKEIVGIPIDDHVGACLVSINVVDAAGNRYSSTAKLHVVNINPTLDIDDVIILEDAPLSIIVTDSESESSDEGYGRYALDNGNTTGTRCVDHGIISVDENNGAISYGPTVNYTGICRIRVIFDDFNPGSSPAYAEFSVSVISTNDPPEIEGTCSTSTLVQDTAFTCNTLTISDNDPEDFHSWSLDPSGTCTWATINTTTGEISGTPNDDSVGTCNLIVKVYDGQADSPLYAQAITITNIGPTFPAVTNIQDVTEDAANVVAIFDADITTSEEGYGIYTLDNPAAAVPRCSDNGSITIDTTTGQLTYSPAANFDQDCHVRVVFDDQNGSVDSVVYQDLVIPLIPDNDIHTIDNICPTSVAQDSAYFCQATTDDVEGAVMVWGLTGATTCGWASIDPFNGQITGTPTNGHVGNCDIVVEAIDGATIATKTFNVDVLNTAPTLSISDTSLNEDSPDTVIRADADVQASEEGLGTYSIISASINDCSSNGTVTINPVNGEIRFNPDANFDQTCNINVQFDDGNAINNTVSGEFSVTMNPSPDTPVASIPASCTGNFNEDNLYSCVPSLTDPDTGDTHTWTIVANTCSWISSINASTGEMTGTPNDDDVGTCSFQIEVTGNEDTLDSNDVSATVVIDNVKPVLSIATNPAQINMQHQTAPAKYASVISNTASDFNITSTDETFGNFSIVAPSAGTPCSGVADSLSIDTTTGVISFLPNNMYVGQCTIGVQFDDQNSTDNISDPFNLTVDVVDQVPPLVVSIDSTSADGTYLLNQTIDLVVTFDEEVVVDTTNGSPRIFLETGFVDRSASFIGVGGVGNTQMRFQYTVEPNDISSDLSTHSDIDYVDLAGSVVEDIYGNSELTYPLIDPTDATGNSLVERRDLDVNGAIAIAEVTDLPDLVSPVLSMDAVVGGSGVVEYQYKVLQATDPNSDCSLAAGYSGNIAISTHITDSLTTVPIGSKIRLCVVGITALGIVAPYSMAFEYEWHRDTKSVQKVSFGEINDLPNFQDSEVDPDNPSIIYAKNMLGEVFKSIDYGSNWDYLCKISQSYDTSIEVSPGPDRTPYIFHGHDIYKIEDKDGGWCTNLTSSLGEEAYITYTVKNVQILPNGDLYFLSYSSGSAKIFKSFDQGANWTEHLTVPNVHFNSALSFTVNPSDPSHVLVSSYNSNTSANNDHLYETFDGGITFNARSLVYSGFNAFRWHPTLPDVLFIGREGILRRSRNQGANFESVGSTTASQSYDRYDIDKVSGLAYRLRVSGSDTLLQRGSNLSNSGSIVWTTIYTFSNRTGNASDALNVSVSGNSALPSQPTISVNIRNYMYISNDGGSTFTEIFAPKELKLVTIAGAGDDAIYGATKDWFVVKTSDNGDSWNYKLGDYYHCLGKGPRLSVNQLDPNNILMWTENYGVVDCDNFNYSVNGMNSIISRDEFSMVAPKLLVSMSSHDPKKYYMSGRPGTAAHRFHLTSNTSYETTLRYSNGNQFSDPMPDSFIHPNDSNLVWMVDNVSNGRLMEYNLRAQTKTDLTANTGLSSIAAMDVYVGTGGLYHLRVMDKTGRMKVSTDYGATFVDEGVTGSPLASCDKRFLYHHPRDRNLVITACLGEDTVAISPNSGASWEEIDFYADYDIDCNVSGLAASSSRIYIGCLVSDTMIYNYSFAALKNEVSDSVLTASENALSNDLVEHYFPSAYTSVEYKVIPASQDCDGSVSGFSTTIPKTDDPAFVSRGEYKVCMKQTDVTAAITYVSTSTIFFDTGSPVFTSIDLINDVADAELTIQESYNNNYLVGNLVSTNNDFVRYAVIESADTCNSSVDFQFEIPKSSDPIFKENTTYKVCVELTTRGQVSVAYGVSSDISFIPNEPLAILSGLPDGYVTTDTALDVSVSGTGLSQYKYKLINSASDSCYSSSGYSSAIPISTKISNSLSSFSNGDNLFLCVLGGDATGYFQPVQKVTLHKFVYSTNHRIDFIDFSSISTMTDWRQVAVAPNDENIIYALNTMGEIWKTFNKGITWDLQCRVQTYRSNMHLKVSPGLDKTAYLSFSWLDQATVRDYLYRIDDKDGLNCTDLLGTFRGDLVSDRIQATFSISPKGDLYTVENQYDSIVIRKSSDYGRNWYFVSQLQDAGLDGQLVFNPQNPLEMLVSTKTVNSGSGTRGLYRTTDGGDSWSFVQGTGFNGNQYIFYDPTNTSRVYANNTYFSTDGGASWSTNSQFNSNSERWWVDNSGSGYRLEHSGADTTLLKSSSLITPNFIPINIFFGIQSSATSKNIVQATGNTVAVIIGDKRLFISTNGGTSFSEIFWPGKNLMLTGISSRDGSQIYGVARSWNIVSSTDAADNWEFKTQYFVESCTYDARVYAHHLDNNYAWVYSDNCRFRTMTTSDGFSTSTKSNISAGSEDGSYFTSSTLLNDYMMGSSGIDEFRFTSNGWSSWSFLADEDNFLTHLTDEFHSPMNFSLTSDPSKYLVVRSDNTLSLLSKKDKIELNDINNRLASFSAPAGIAIQSDPYNLEINHYVVATNGRINKTRDNAKSFSSVGTGSTGLTSCSERILYVYPYDNDIMAQACKNNYEVSWSTNGGSSWSRINLDSDYGIDCELTGLVMNDSQVMFSCRTNYSAFSIYHTPVDLINAASDNIIKSSEASGLNLVKINYPSEYSSIEYAIINSSGTCNSSTPGYSFTPPKDTDLVADGSYKVCVKLTKGAATNYRVSTTIKVDLTAPSFSSIALANDAIDGIQYVDWIQTSSDLVSTLVASDYTRALYALVRDSVTCDGSITYSTDIPQSNSELFSDEGDYKVCVSVTDDINPPAFGSSPVFSFSKNQVLATMSGLPNRVSTDGSLNISIGGTNVDFYRYKYGVAPVDCTDETGYSANRATSLAITNMVGGLANYEICVVGIDSSSGENQLFSFATKYSWQRAFDELDYINLNIVSNSFNREWFDVEVAKWPSLPYIYAKDTSGNIYLSTDRGFNFNLLCSVEHDANSKLVIAKNKEHGVIATANGQAYRVSDQGGNECPMISTGFTKIPTSYNRASLAFNSAGHIYAIDEVSTTQSILKKSTDLGASWQTLRIFNDEGHDMTLNIDPHNDQTIFIVYSSTSLTYPGAYIVSRNGGESFYGISPGGGGASLSSIQDPNIDFKFDPVNKGLMYTNNGWGSQVNLNNIEFFDDIVVDDFSKWDIDSSGVGYRLIQNGSNLDVETSSDLISPAFSVWKSIPSVSAASGNRSISSSADGQTIVVIANKRLYVSRDNLAFSETYTPVPRAKLSSISSEDHTRVYGVDDNWNIFRSTNAGNSWVHVSSYSSGCSGKSLRVKTSMVNQNYAMVYADDDTTGGCSNIYTTQNGFVSASARTGWTSSVSMAFDTVLANRAALIASGVVWSSVDFFSTHASYTTNNITNNGHSFDAHMSTVDSNMLYHILNGIYYEVDATNGTKTDMNSSLTLSNPAGMQGYGDAQVYVISNQGAIDISTNNGSSYSSYSSNAPLLSCSNRLLKANTANRSNDIVTGCYGGQRVAFTRDAGASWKEIDLSTYSISSSCIINDISIINTSDLKIAVACKGEYAIQVSMD